MQKNLALITKYFKKIYKPTNNNLITSSNSRNKNVDTTPREPKRVKDFAYHKEKMLLCKQAEQGVPLQAEPYDWLADTDEEVDEHELEAHYSYMAKILEVPTANSGTDSEPLEQVQNNTGYNVFANDLQHFEQSESVSNTCLVETDDSNVVLDSPDMCEDDIQNDQNNVEIDDERVALANLISNLKLDVVENKKIQNKSLRESISVRDSCLVALQTKQIEFENYKAFNDRTIDYDNLEQKLNETLGLVKQKTKVITNLNLREGHDIDKMISMEKQLKFLYEIVYKISQSIQTIHIMEPKVPTYNGRPTFANPRYLKQAQSEISCLYTFPYDQSTHANRLIPDGEETLALERESRSKLNKDLVRQKHSISLEIALQKRKEQNIAISELKKLIEKGKGKYVDTKFDKPFVVRQPNAQRIPKPSVLGKPAPFSYSLARRYFPKTNSVPKTNVSEGLSKPVTAQTLPQTARQAVRVNHKPNVSRPQHKSNQSRDKVLPNNSQVKVRKTQVEVHPMIPSVSNKMKFVTACKDNLNSRTLNANAVYATCSKCLVDSNHFACVTKMLNHVNDRTKKPIVVPISIIDFLNRSSVSYALTTSPTMCTSCIKQFWATVKIKTINDEVRIQALIDEKRVNIKESSIRRNMKLDDAEGTSCLANAEIFDGLAKMGYEKLYENSLSTRLSSHPNESFSFILYCSALSSQEYRGWVPFFMLPRFVQLLIDHQLGDISHYKDIYDNPSLTKKVFANIKRVGAGFSGVVTALFDTTLVPATKKVGLIQANVQLTTVPTKPSTSKPHKKHKSKKQKPQAPKVPPPEPSLKHWLPSPSNDQLPGGQDSMKLKELMDLCTHLSNKVLELKSEVVNIKSSSKERIKKLKGRVAKLEEENIIFKELHSVLSMQDVDEEEPAKVEEVLEVVKAAKLMTKVVTTAGATTTAEAPKVSVPRRRRGVIIQDPEEITSTVVMHSKVQSKDKGKGILIEEPKHLKGKAQIEQDEAFARQLEAELNAYINWNAIVEQVTRSKRLNDIVANDDDDVYSEATPLASKIPVFNYKIYFERNKPYFKIIRADGNHMLFLSFSTMLKNFDRKDFETLWKLAKERFEKTEPKNHSDD
uniref:Uncharacterized protein n=1 Tax=Tanacetum cinerariifolium TaxID=118510 RepID=A0A6L2MRF6_TANCI|nr:hypothetical protein [Tanacetum cinerariifolium]